MRLLVSGCLFGLDCRYCGDGIYQEELMKLTDEYELIPVCPEQLGGLPTPRAACEIQSGKVIDIHGNDRTEAFVKGGKEVLKLAKIFNVDGAILKCKSPSCGYGKIYDGSFSGKLIEGNGITAQMLSEQGIPVWNELNYKKAFSKKES